MHSEKKIKNLWAPIERETRKGKPKGNSGVHCNQALPTVSLRQAGTLEPLLKCLYLDKCLLRQSIQRKYKGLKITTCMPNWDKSSTITYKRAATQLPFLRYEKEKQGAAHDPNILHHRGGGQTA